VQLKLWGPFTLITWIWNTHFTTTVRTPATCWQNTETSHTTNNAKIPSSPIPSGIRYPSTDTALTIFISPLTMLVPLKLQTELIEMFFLFSYHLVNGFLLQEQAGCLKYLLKSVMICILRDCRLQNLPIINSIPPHTGFVSRSDSSIRHVGS